VESLPITLFIQPFIKTQSNAGTTNGVQAAEPDGPTLPQGTQKTRHQPRPPSLQKYLKYIYTVAKGNLTAFQPCERVHVGIGEPHACPLYRQIGSPTHVAKKQRAEAGNQSLFHVFELELPSSFGMELKLDQSHHPLGWS
jgi:hypothetical protein